METEKENVEEVAQPELRAPPGIHAVLSPYPSPAPSPESPVLPPANEINAVIPLDEIEPFGAPSEPERGGQTDVGETETPLILDVDFAAPTLPRTYSDLDEIASAEEGILDAEVPEAADGLRGEPVLGIESPDVPSPITEATEPPRSARSNITYSYVPPPSVPRWGMDRTLPRLPSPTSSHPAPSPTSHEPLSTRKKGTYFLNTRPRILRATFGLTIWAIILCSLAATGGWIIVGMGGSADVSSGWEEWMAWGRWWDGSGTVRVTLGLAGYCVRTLLSPNSTFPAVPSSPYVSPPNGTQEIESYFTTCSFYSSDVSQSLTISGNRTKLPAIFVPFSANSAFVSRSFLLAMPILFAAHAASMLLAMMMPIVWTGVESRMWTKFCSMGAIGALIAGFGMAIAFCETWRNGMVASASTTSVGLDGLELDGQQFQYGGAFGAALACIITSLFGVLPGLARGLKRPGQRKEIDDMYDWMD